MISMPMIPQVTLPKFGAIQSYRRVSLLHVHGSLRHRQRDTGMVYNMTFGLRYTSLEPMISMSMIPQVSLLIFLAIQVIEGCLCSMSMEAWDIENATLVWSTTRLLVWDTRVQSL